MLTPSQAFVFFQNWIVGDSPIGLSEFGLPAIGGEVQSLAGVLPGTTVVFYGSGTTASSVVEPSKSVADWYKFLATATLTEKPGPT
jgi:carboxypeptidase D